MANDVSSDTSCKALWRFESGALAVDSKGSNTFNFINSPAADTSKFKEGVSSLALVAASSQYGYIPDASLPSDFPLKSTDTVMQMTACCRVYANSNGAYRRIWAKEDYFGNKRTLCLWVNSGEIGFDWGNGGSSNLMFSTGLVMSPGQWYHITVIVDGVNQILKVVLYNEVTGFFSFYNVTPSYAMGVGTADFTVGTSGTYPSSIDGVYWDGNIDEFVIFNRLLSLSEILSIKNQNYVGPYTPASPGNNFDGDSRFQALWRFESGALLTDSIGSNTLTSPGTSITDPFGVMEGESAAYLLGAYGSYFVIPDADLSSDFPFKSTDTTQLMTICGWVAPLAIYGTIGIWCKNSASFSGIGSYIKSDGHLYIGYGAHAPSWPEYDTGIILSPFGIYHLAFVIDNISQTLHVRVYDKLSDSVANYSTDIDLIPLAAYDFLLGMCGFGSSGWNSFQGYLDEWVVANALLSDDEIDAIRNGTFSPVSADPPDNCLCLTNCAAIPSPPDSCLVETYCQAIPHIDPPDNALCVVYCEEIALPRPDSCLLHLYCPESAAGAPLSSLCLTRCPDIPLSFGEGTFLIF